MGEPDFPSPVLPRSELMFMMAPLFLAPAQVDEARAGLEALRAQADGLRLQVRLEEVPAEFRREEDDRREAHGQLVLLGFYDVHDGLQRIRVPVKLEQPECPQDAQAAQKLVVRGKCQGDVERHDDQEIDEHQRCQSILYSPQDGIAVARVHVAGPDSQEVLDGEYYY